MKTDPIKAADTIEALTLLVEERARTVVGRASDREARESLRRALEQLAALEGEEVSDG